MAHRKLYHTHFRIKTLFMFPRQDNTIRELETFSNEFWPLTQPAYQRCVSHVPERLNPPSCRFSNVNRSASRVTDSKYPVSVPSGHQIASPIGTQTSPLGVGSSAAVAAELEPVTPLSADAATTTECR